MQSKRDKLICAFLKSFKKSLQETQTKVDYYSTIEKNNAPAYNYFFAKYNAIYDTVEALELILKQKD